MTYMGDETYYRVCLRKYRESVLGKSLTCTVDISCEDYEMFCKIVESIKEVMGNG